MSDTGQSMTDAERIEAAANELEDIQPWPDRTSHEDLRGMAKLILAAAYPELHGDKPVAWLAPAEQTAGMLDGARDWSLAKYGCGVGNDGARGCYVAMREAHLHRHSDKG